MFYLMSHSTHFIYGYMVNDHSDNKTGLATRDVLYVPSHTQDSTYHDERKKWSSLAFILDQQPQ